MNNIYELPNSEDKIGEASEWIAKIDRGLSGQEFVALQKWAGTQPENQEALVAVAEVWDKMDSLSRLTGLLPYPANAPGKFEWMPFAMASTVLLAIFIGLWSTVGSNFNNWSTSSSTLFAIEENVFETKIGEQLTFVLSDGSRLSLNTNTRVSYRYTQYARLVTLERGEVHIDVMKDEARPYSVFAGNNVVQAVGTAFNIELNSDQRIELIVTEGKVLVAAIDKTLNVNASWDRQSLPPALPQSAFIVSEGEQLVSSDGNEDVELIEPEDLKVKLAWRDNNLVFHGESLDKAIAEIERYTTVEFVIVGESLKKVRIAGVFKTDDVDGLLKTLRENFNVFTERVGDEKVILTQ